MRLVRLGARVRSLLAPHALRARKTSPTPCPWPGHEEAPQRLVGHRRVCGGVQGQGVVERVGAHLRSACFMRAKHPNSIRQEPTPCPTNAKTTWMLLRRNSTGPFFRCKMTIDNLRWTILRCDLVPRWWAASAPSRTRRLASPSRTCQCPPT